MLLTKLEIKGFKSFAHRTVLEFPLPADKQTKGITSIVGPNGSGKSNVADAIRWVLGEQSLKLLRGKKSDDVIFSGSDQKTRLSTAEVSLFLENSDGEAAIDCAEIEITRRIYRNGEGEYLINNKPVRLLDVALLLARSHMGQKTYSVIGQGMIDSVLNATIAERKEFFYEAAGVKEFQIKKHQAENKLERTRENLRQTEITLNEIEPHLKSLTRQVKRLKQREEVETELRSKQKIYYTSVLGGIILSHKEKEEKWAALAQDEAVKEQQVVAWQEDLRKMEEEDSRADIFAALSRDYSAINREKNELMRELSSVQGKLDLQYERQGGLNIVWLKQRVAEIKEELISLNQKQKMQAEKQAEKRLELAARKEEQGQLVAQIETFNRKIEELRKRLGKENNYTQTEILQELEVTLHAQKNLFLSLESVQTLDQLAHLKNELELVIGRMEKVILKIQGKNEEKTEEEMITWQSELNIFLEKKGTLLGEVRRLESELNLLAQDEHSIRETINRLAREEAKCTATLEEEALVEAGKDDQIAEKLGVTKTEIESKLSVVEEKLKIVTQKIAEFNLHEEEKKHRLIALQRNLQDEQQALTSIVAAKNNLKIELTRLEVRREDLDREILRDFHLRPSYAKASLGEQDYGGQGSETIVVDDINSIQIVDVQEELRLETDVAGLKHRLELIGGIDEESVKEYESTKERYDFLKEQFDDLSRATKSLKELVLELEKNIDLRFNNSFRQINKEFENFFRRLFKGGKASLEKVVEDVVVNPTKEAGVESTEIASELSQLESGAPEISTTPQKTEKVFSGIDIYACPPGKKVSHISVLSGGEKAMTSLALICAIISTNPAPFVVLDEVDAALDEMNSEKMSDILEYLSKKTQFIVITHNRSTMLRSNILYGVTMGGDGISNLVSLKLDEAEKMVRRRE